MAIIFALIVKKPPNDEDEISKEIASTNPVVSAEFGNKDDTKDGLLP